MVTPLALSDICICTEWESDSAVSSFTTRAWQRSKGEGFLRFSLSLSLSFSLSLSLPHSLTLSLSHSLTLSLSHSLNLSISLSLSRDFMCVFSCVLSPSLSQFLFLLFVCHCKVSLCVFCAATMETAGCCRIPQLHSVTGYAVLESCTVCSLAC